MLARLINEPEGGLRLENSGGVRSTRMSDNVASAAIFPALSRPLRDTEYVIASFISASNRLSELYEPASRLSFD